MAGTETAGGAVAGLEAGIRAAGTPERAAASRAYLKTSLECSGTTVPAARAQLRAWLRERPGLGRAELLAVVSGLWDRPLFECRMAAGLLLVERQALLTAADMAMLEGLLRTSGTWALVDSLAADVAGSLVQRYPELTPVLDRWAGDPDFWIRRSALLALLVPLRRGEGDFERFARYADQMLEEREFFIRKAIGWVLRETGKRHPELVAQWLAPRVDRASGVTVREAVRWLPADRRDELMTAYRASRAR